MLQILVFLSIILVKRENTLTLQDSWNDLQFGMEGVLNKYLTNHLVSLITCRLVLVAVEVFRCMLISFLR